MGIILKLSRQDEDDIKQFAEKLTLCTSTIKSSIVIYLEGDLGAGKTTLARAYIQHHGFKRVKSPTYTLVESYKNNNVQIHHFDCYRISNPEELEYIGVREYSSPGNIQLIEWPANGNGAIPEADLSISISGNDNHRDVLIDAFTETGDEILQCLDI